ncbi:hypothetical protein BCR37DRAFT_386864 [Protomyces lactucae-debilis]|uniref:Leucine-rich repeat-containing protein 40 n=1 Tax=Protomyces lactucae-debilis TaxID=2754530 RepID=A0A1Y2FJW2_PROLT|nr:uncharacterized protein BCR37DRAFT_386864 [Protomyces lactucae-debilis]ORY83877.1 hypothetical protein BCR37DRAFT_386864 [Protomyces lactucae-debilis]
MSRIPVRTASLEPNPRERSPSARVKRAPAAAQSVLSKSTSHASLLTSRSSKAPINALSQSVRGTASSASLRTVSQPPIALAAAQTAKTPLRASSSGQAVQSASQSKGSLALREHIAKARAELTKSTRGEQRTRAALPSSWTSETPTQADRTPNPYDGIQDPFNQSRFTPKVVPGIKSAIERAKGSGHLMIAFKELQAIPRQVYDMYKPDPNHVIDFSAMDSAAWYEAVELKSLNAADNEISEIEMDLADTFEALQTLDLHNNMLSKLPSNLSKLTQLTTLSLAGNKLEMNVFDILTRLPHLLVLNLAKNALEGTLPSLSAMHDLQDLNLSENQVDDIGTALQSSLSLRSLNLHANRISRFQVTQLPQPSKLRSLDLSNNRLQAAFLNEDTELPMLEELKLEWNRFTAFAEEGCFLTAPRLRGSMISANVRSA